MKGKIRCSWCSNDQLYKNYHDIEWGVPISDDNKLFEFLILEIFQAGLSWYTVLKKRKKFIIIKKLKHLCLIKALSEIG